jgi:hypothetical protein
MASVASTQHMKEKLSMMDSSSLQYSPRIKTILEGSEYDWDNPWIETASGKHFHFLKPLPEDIDIDDIAHALANTCRYTGHCRKFYSVAEHSVAVSELSPDAALAGLLHDASEAYITDIASPVKPFLKNYKQLENTVMEAIAAKFGFSMPLHPQIKEADVIQLSVEAWHLVPSQGIGWTYWTMNGGRPKSKGIAPRCLFPKEAKKLFLSKFKELT